MEQEVVCFVHPLAYSCDIVRKKKINQRYTKLQPEFIFKLVYQLKFSSTYSSFQLCNVFNYRPSIWPQTEKSCTSLLWHRAEEAVWSTCKSLKTSVYYVKQLWYITCMLKLIDECHKTTRIKTHSINLCSASFALQKNTINLYMYAYMFWRMVCNHCRKIKNTVNTYINK